MMLVKNTNKKNKKVLKVSLGPKAKHNKWWNSFRKHCKNYLSSVYKFLMKIKPVKKIFKFAKKKLMHYRNEFYFKRGALILQLHAHLVDHQHVQFFRLLHSSSFLYILFATRLHILAIQDVLHDLQMLAVCGDRDSENFAWWLKANGYSITFNTIQAKLFLLSWTKFFVYLFFFVFFSLLLFFTFLYFNGVHLSFFVSFLEHLNNTIL